MYLIKGGEKNCQDEIRVWHNKNMALRNCQLRRTPCTFQYFKEQETIDHENGMGKHSP